MASFSRTWIPNQHGAWAMLIAPVAVGALAGGFTPWHLLLLLTWLAAFCVNYFVSLALKSRRPARYRQQLTLYTFAALVFGLSLVAHDFDVLRMGLFAVPAFAVNVFFVLQRNERAWINDVVGIALAGVVGYGAYMLGGNPKSDAAALHAFLSVLAMCLYFVGTVIYVKTLIRERGSAHWLRASYAYHAALLAICASAHLWALTAIAIALLMRAREVPRLNWTPKRVGLTEIIYTSAVALGALLTLP